MYAQGEVNELPQTLLSSKAANLQKTNFDVSLRRHSLLCMFQLEPNYLINNKAQTHEQWASCSKIRAVETILTGMEKYSHRLVWKKAKKWKKKPKKQKTKNRKLPILFQLICFTFCPIFIIYITASLLGMKCFTFKALRILEAMIWTSLSFLSQLPLALGMNCIFRVGSPFTHRMTTQICSLALLKLKFSSKDFSHF